MKDGAMRLIHTAVSCASFFLTTLVERRLHAALLGACPTEKMQDDPLHVLGPEAPGLSPATISRLQHSWHEALTQGQGRSLRGKRYVYFWGDGVYGSVPDLDVSGCKRL